MSILNIFQRAKDIYFNKNISGMTSKNVQDAIDETMAALNAVSVFESGVLPVKNGGTGRNNLTSGYFLKGNGTAAVAMQSAAAARNSMGLGNSTSYLQIANGGTNANTATDAFSNLLSLITLRGAGTKRLTADTILATETFLKKDPNDIFSNSNGSITIGKNGYYFISVHIIAISKVSSGRATACVKINNELSDLITCVQMRSTTDMGIMSISRPVYLKSGDVIALTNYRAEYEVSDEGAWMTVMYIGS